MPSSIIKDHVPHSLLFSFLTNHFFVFLRMYLDASTLCTSLLLAKTSSQLRPRSASSLVIPVFNEVIGVILLIHIDTLYLPMSRSLSSLLSYLLPTLMSYLYHSFILSRILLLYLQLHLGHCKFIPDACVLTPGLRLTHLL